MGRQRSDRQTPRVAGAPAEGERPPDSRQGGLHQGGLRAAGIATARLAAPILSRHQGGVLGRLKAEWAVIVGAQLAAATWPAALGRDGALKLRVASNLALDLQHRAPLMIERINRFLGRDAVVRLVLVQGPLPLPAPPAPAPPPPLPAAEANTLDIQLGDIADPGLRAALAGLGRLVLAGARRGD